MTVLDSLLYVLEQGGPFLLVPLLFLCAFSAVTFCAHVTSGFDSPSLRERRSRLFGVTVALTVVLSLIWSMFAPGLAPMDFDSATWRGKSWRRSSMVRALLSQGVLSGLKQAEVVALLGEGDGSYDFADSWYVWRPRDAMDFFPPELVVEYDREGTVKRCFIEPALLEVLPRSEAGLR